MKIDKYFNLSANRFFKNSRKKIDEVKKKLNLLSHEEKKLEKKEKRLQKELIPEVRVVISIDSVVKATIAILLVFAMVYLLEIIKSIIILFLVSLFLAAAFNPIVDRLHGLPIPRIVGILFLYIIALGVLTFIFSSLIPVLASQISELAISARDMIQNLVTNKSGDSWLIAKIQPFLNQVWQNVDQAQMLSTLTNTLKDVASRLTGFAGNAVGAVLTIFNGIFNMLLVLMITFFMVINSQHTSNFFHSLFPSRYSGYISQKSKEISIKIGEWIRGQLILSLGMAILTLIVFTAIGLKYALTLSMVSALGEFIPYLGPVIAFSSAALIGLNQDPVLVLWLIPAYAVIQFVESNIMSPLILGKSVGLNPLIIIFALMSGATIGTKLGGSVGLGLVGMILAVPIANIVSLFVEEYAEKKK